MNYNSLIVNQSHRKLGASVKNEMVVVGKVCIWGMPVPPSWPCIGLVTRRSGRIRPLTAWAQSIMVCSLTTQVYTTLHLPLNRLNIIDYLESKLWHTNVMKLGVLACRALTRFVLTAAVLLGAIIFIGYRRWNIEFELTREELYHDELAKFISRLPIPRRWSW